jgi:MFS transporter, ACS family, D-galactonate transporter
MDNPLTIDKIEKKSRIRWRIFILLLFVGALSYIDRISLSVGMPLIAAEFNISPEMQGVLLSSFFWTYAIFQIPGGWLADKIGPRKILTWAVTLWSICQLLTGLSHNIIMMLLARLGLGVAEAPQYPTGAKLAAMWLPLKERARGAVLMDSSSTLGAAIGSLIVAGLITLLGGWRESFIAVSCITAGAGWVLHKYIRDRPDQHPLINKAELEYIECEHKKEDKEGERKEYTGNARQFFRHPTFWFMGFGFMAANMLFYGLLTFGPLYLYQERALDIKGLAGASFAIYIAGFIGENFAGWLTQKLLSTGIRQNIVMRSLLGLSAAFATVAILSVAYVKSSEVAVVLLAVTLFFCRFLGLYWSLPGSLTVRSQAGILGGMMNFFSNTGGIIIPIVTGFIVSVTGSYFSALILFSICGLVYLICSLMINYEKKLILGQK